MSTTPNDPNQPGDNDPSQGGPSYGSTPSYGDSSSSGAAPQYGQSTPAYGDASQPAYGGSQAYGSPAGGGTNGLAIAALICGVLSILTCLFWFISVPLGIAAIVLGVLGNKKAKTGQAGQGGLAKAGLITGIVGTVLSVVFAILILAGMNMFGQGIENCSDPSLSDEEVASCLEEEFSN